MGCFLSFLFKKDVFSLYNKGYSNKSIAKDTGISVATVERFYHQMIRHKGGHLKSKCCPHILGIDEHRFTRKKGFATTFCDLKQQTVFDVALGKDSSKLLDFICNIQGRERVRVVCIDMNSGYRSFVRQYFWSRWFMRLLMTRRENLAEQQRTKLAEYFLQQPAIQAIYAFCHELSDFLTHKGAT